MPDDEVGFDGILNRILQMLLRRRRLIALTASVIPIATVCGLYKIPNRYSSEATILVVQQQVPERYVTPTATTDISKSLEAMTQEVLSRSRLLRIIDELSLYPNKRKLAPEQILELMRKDVSITPLQNNPERREINAFKISYISSTPQLAQEVTSRLTTLFIQQNLKNREDQATITTKFLQEQMDAAKRKLVEQEQHLRDFKMENLGELPEQQQGNIGILGGLQGQLQNTVASLNRAQQQRQYIQSLLGEYRRISARRTTTPSVPGVPTTVATTPLEAAQNALATLKADRTALLDRYTPGFPAVLEVDKKIARQEELVERLKVAKPASGDKQEVAQGAPTPTDVVSEDPATAQLKSQFEANQLEIETLQRDEQRLKSEIAQYQARLNLTPVREQQLTSILRDYELLKQNYSDLVNKQLQSQLATTLEKRQEGQQFRLVDPPSLPALPSSPNRLKLSLGGIAGGIALALALALLLELKIGAVFDERSIQQRISVPVVVGIPELLTRSEKRTRGWVKSLEWAVASLLMAAVGLAEFYVLRHG